MASALRLIMRSSKTGRKTSSVASAAWHVAPSCWNLFNFCSQEFIQHSPITIAVHCKDKANYLSNQTWDKYYHLGHKHNWTIFLRKWARRGRYSQWRSLSGHVVCKNWIGGYWQHLVTTERRYMPHSRSYTRSFAPCFLRSHYQP